MLNTPILFLVFNRPEKTQLVFENIRQQQPKHLFIVADGPREDHPEDLELCTDVRIIVSQIDWKCEVKTLFRENNWGSKYSVSSAITWFFEHFEEGIILEDDCSPNDSFFPFCETLLEKYKDKKQVMMICGTSYQPNPLNDNSYYFSNYVHVWGWATWRRAWQLYNVELDSLNNEECTRMLRNKFKVSREIKTWLFNFNLILKGLDAWDYQWMYWIWKNDGMSIIPWKNMISNIGFDNEATHTFDKDSDQARMKQYELKEIIHPEELSVNKKADAIERYKIIISPIYKILIHRILSRLTRILPSLKSKER